MQHLAYADMHTEEGDASGTDGQSARCAIASVPCGGPWQNPVKGRNSDPFTLD